jgi:hypothetical protein
VNRLWATLPDENRRRALIALSRVVTQQLAAKIQARREVAHERP